ncbi:hypothetical protein V6Z12_D07G159000 [Gossypium hirsutum]
MEGEKRYISAEELKEHNKSGDLWISIQGKVYDVSEWAKEHPGGEIPLLNLAGQDVTDAFLAYHPGTAWQYLDKLFTGYHLKNFEVSEVSKDYRRLVSEFAKAGNDWFEKQTSGTIDISCPSMMDWFFGGLQFQLEHHLFPRLPRCHLRKVSPLVRELCKKHKLPYRSLSFWEANKSTIRTLRTAALQARDLTNPAPKNLLWEAFNTHG